VVSTCRRLAGIVPINLPHQFLLHQSSLPPVPRSSRPIGRGASGRSGCSKTRPRSNGGGERRGVRLRMCGGRRRRCERVIRGVDDRLTGGRVVTKFFHLPALLSSRRVGDDGHLSSIACRLASTPEGRKIRVLVMLAGGRWGSCPTVPHGELRHCRRRRRRRRLAADPLGSGTSRTRLGIWGGVFSLSLPPSFFFLEREDAADKRKADEPCPLSPIGP